MWKLKYPWERLLLYFKRERKKDYASPLKKNWMNISYPIVQNSINLEKLRNLSKVKLL